MANELFYEVLPELRNEGDAPVGTLRPPSYYKDKYEPHFRALLQQLKEYTTCETKEAEKKAGNDPIPLLFRQSSSAFPQR